MKISRLAAISPPALLVVVCVWTCVLCPGRSDGVDTAQSRTPVALDDFAECATALGWKEVYRASSDDAQRVKAVKDYPSAGLKADRNVIVVFHWVVLSSVEVPPSSSKRVRNGYMNRKKTAYRFRHPGKFEFEINFSSSPAKKENGRGSFASIKVETKVGERELVGVLQQTVAIYSADQPFRLLKKGYTDSFAFCRFRRVKKLARSSGK